MSTTPERYIGVRDESTERAIAWVREWLLRTHNGTIRPVDLRHLGLRSFAGFANAIIHNITSDCVLDTEVGMIPVGDIFSDSPSLSSAKIAALHASLHLQAFGAAAALSFMDIQAHLLAAGVDRVLSERTEADLYAFARVLNVSPPAARLPWPAVDAVHGSGVDPNSASREAEEDDSPMQPPPQPPVRRGVSPARSRARSRTPPRRGRGVGRRSRSTSPTAFAAVDPNAPEVPATAEDARRLLSETLSMPPAEGVVAAEAVEAPVKVEGVKIELGAEGADGAAESAATAAAAPGDAADADAEAAAGGAGALAVTPPPPSPPPVSASTAALLRGSVYGPPAVQPVLPAGATLRERADAGEFSPLVEALVDALVTPPSSVAAVRRDVLSAHLAWMCAPAATRAAAMATVAATSGQGDRSMAVDGDAGAVAVQTGTASTAAASGEVKEEGVRSEGVVPHVTAAALARWNPDVPVFVEQQVAALADGSLAPPVAALPPGASGKEDVKTAAGGGAAAPAASAATSAAAADADARSESSGDGSSTSTDSAGGAEGAEGSTVLPASASRSVRRLQAVRAGSQRRRGADSITSETHVRALRSLSVAALYDAFSIRQLNMFIQTQGGRLARTKMSAARMLHSLLRPTASHSSHSGSSRGSSSSSSSSSDSSGSGEDDAASQDSAQEGRGGGGRKGAAPRRARGRATAKGGRLRSGEATDESMDWEKEIDAALQTAMAADAARRGEGGGDRREGGRSGRNGRGTKRSRAADAAAAAGEGGGGESGSDDGDAPLTSAPTSKRSKAGAEGEAAKQDASVVIIDSSAATAEEAEAAPKGKGRSGKAAATQRVRGARGGRGVSRASSSSESSSSGGSESENGTDSEEVSRAKGSTRRGPQKRSRKAR